MIYPVIPSDNLVVILVHGTRCIVARYRQIGPYEFELEHAANWEALEAEACAAVQEMVGAIVESNVYPCPGALAARAE